MENLADLWASIEFRSPESFWFATALVLLLIFIRLPVRRGAGLAFDMGGWRSWVSSSAARGAWVLSAIIVLNSLALGIALADPQRVTTQRIAIYGRPVMAVVDVSGSAQYVGRAGDQLVGFQKAREVLYEVLGRDSVADYGLLLYSSENYIARYFAPKRELLNDTLDNEAEMRGISYGTRTAAALEKAYKFFTERLAARDKAIVLISDLQESPSATAQTVKGLRKLIDEGVRIYIILMREDSDLAMEEDPRIWQIEALEGVRIMGMNDKLGHQQVCDEIAEMPSSAITHREVVSRQSLIPSLIAPMIGFTVLSLILSESYLRKIP